MQKAPARDRVAQSKVPAPTEEQRQRREVYQRYASKLGDRSPQECDLIVACQLLDKLIKARGGHTLTQDELDRVGRVLLESPTSRELKQSQGEDASIAYVTEVMGKAQPTVERVQRDRLAEQAERSQKKDQGMEL